MNKLNEFRCTRCDYHLSNKMQAYSINLCGYELCYKCQKWYANVEKHVTIQSKNLFLALKVRGVNVEMEKYDGFKHIDLAITGKKTKLNIEIDGLQHYNDAKQSYSDLLRTYHSFKKGFYTIRLPNILVSEKREETADVIVDILKHLQT